MVHKEEIFNIVQSVHMAWKDKKIDHLEAYCDLITAITKLFFYELCSESESQCQDLNDTEQHKELHKFVNFIFKRLPNSIMLHQLLLVQAAWKNKQITEEDVFYEIRNMCPHPFLNTIRLSKKTKLTDKYPGLCDFVHWACHELRHIYE